MFQVLILWCLAEYWPSVVREPEACWHRSFLWYGHIGRNQLVISEEHSCQFMPQPREIFLFSKNLHEKLGFGPCCMNSSSIMVYGNSLMHLKICWSDVRGIQIWGGRFRVDALGSSSILFFTRRNTPSSLTGCGLPLRGRPLTGPLLYNRQQGLWSRDFEERGTTS